MSEHPVEHAIVMVRWAPENDYYGTEYRLGSSGITRIEACTKSGMHADIPYIRVWQGDECVAEFCQHSIVGVWFEHSPPPPDPDLMPF
jgi:isocitrate dehydrogenase